MPRGVQPSLPPMPRTGFAAFRLAGFLSAITFPETHRRRERSTWTHAMSPERDPITPYSYTCVDLSPLVRPFCRFVVRWFVVWMPQGVPANLLTLGSSACAWAMLAVAALSADPTRAAPWCLLLMAIYVIYDHADGMHARRTGTSGPLGEFLDHYLDAFHGAFALLTLFIIAGQPDSRFLIPAVWAVSLAGTATMVEEKARGILHFGFVGPLEGMLLVMAFLATFSVRPVATFWQYRILAQATSFEIAMGVAALGALATVAGCCKRVGRVPVLFALHAVLNALLGWRLFSAGAPPLAAAAVVALHASDYTGRVILSHVLRRPLPRPDFVPAAFALAAVPLGMGANSATAAVAVYLVVRNIWVTARGFSAMGSYWRWWNPPDRKGDPLTTTVKTLG
jgi:phosphatidylglycerophosphate synthase